MVPPNSVKILASKICTDIKSTGIAHLVVQKFDIEGSTMGGPRGVAPSNYVEIFVCLICSYQKKLAS